MSLWKRKRTLLRVLKKKKKIKIEEYLVSCLGSIKCLNQVQRKKWIHSPFNIRNKSRRGINSKSSEVLRGYLLDCYTFRQLFVPQRTTMTKMEIEFLNWETKAPKPKIMDLFTWSTNKQKIIATTSVLRKGC